MKTNDTLRNEVNEHYSAIARGGTGCCGSTDATKLGYSQADLDVAGNLGLGCGNPRAIAELRAGEVVVDLGAGGGFDAFLAARAVGPTGRVIGVDMSTDMVSLARTNATKQNATNVEFRLGEIEHLPLPDASADVVISNCVINLAPDKRAVYADALRVLKPGGRIAISDVVATGPMPQAIADSLAAHCACVAGAVHVDTLRAMIGELGFADVRVEVEAASKDVIAEWGQGFEQYVASARITATKPGSGLRASAGTKAGACCDPGCCA